MVDIPNWLVAVGTIGGLFVSVAAGKAAARKESERYSREQSKEKEEHRVALAIWQTKMEFMVDELWLSAGRRGKTAAVVNGLGEMNSPLRATQKGRDMFAAVTPEVEAWYRLEGHTYDDAMLRAKIENIFGERIMHDFCLPNGLLHAECIEVVVAIVREDYQNEQAKEQAQLTTV